jgi:hypothetical protein
MRIYCLLAGFGLVACTSGDITIPRDPVLYQAPQPAAAPISASSFVGPSFDTTMENALATPGVVNPGVAPQGGTPLDDDTLNLTLYTIEQQKVDARIAEEELAAARSQLVIIQPTTVPTQAQGVNIALYAQRTNNVVGERIYSRSRTAGLGRGGCGRFSSPDQAQRAFLAAGGPDRDPNNLDPDGDGFACAWDPAPYRQLRS